MASELQALKKKLEHYQLKEKPVKKENSKELKKVLEPVKEEPPVKLTNPFDEFNEEPKKEPLKKKEEVKPKKKSLLQQQKELDRQFRRTRTRFY